MKKAESMKKYLVPLDGSELGEHAIPWAKLLAEKNGIQIEFLRCYEPLASVYMLPEFAPPPIYDEQTSVHKQIDEYLERQLLALPKGLATKLSCEGDPAMAILDRAESGEIEAVIMASHGRGGLGRWLLGSVATKVVRGSQIPVFVINANTEFSHHPEIHKILVPLDGSETAEEALPKAVGMAEAFGAEIVLYQGIAHTPIGNPHLDAAVALEVANAKEYLQDVKSRYPGANCSLVAKVAGPSLGIVEQAKNCDLIVMSSHGRSGFKRWLLGSVAEKVLQAANKPLMIVYKVDEDRALL